MVLPFTQESDFRRERDFGQKISATFEFIGAHWRPLGRVLLYLVLPAALVQNVLSVLVQREVHGHLREPRLHQGEALDNPLDIMQRAVWGTMTRSPLYWLNTAVGTAFITLLVLSIYGYVVLLLQRRTPGPAVAVSEVWQVVRRAFLGTFLSVWGVYLVVGVGFLFLLVPGIYLSVALSLFFIVKLTEGTGFGDTVGRCLRLTRGKWWSTFGLIFIMVLMLEMVLVGLGAVATLLAGGLTAVVHASREQSPLFTVVLTSINSALVLLIYPPLLLVLAFQYFNLVERQQGVGLLRMAQSLGQAPAAPPRSAAYRPDEEGEY